MNPIDHFLISIHYYSPISLFSFLAVVILGLIMRVWNRQAMEIYLILVGFYLVDVFAWVISYTFPIEIGNRWYYNIIQAPQIGIKLFYFSEKLKSEKRRKAYSRIYYFFIIAHLLITSLGIGWLELDVYTIVPMTAIVGIVALDYLRDKFDEVSANPYILPAFWFAFATMISDLGSVPVTSLYLRLEHSNMHLANQIWHINDVVYGLWFLITAFGLIWINRKTTPSYS